MALEGGWAIKCVPPSCYKICTNWQAYLSLESALTGAKDYIDRSIALRMIGATLLELCEAGKLDKNECQGLLLSLESATCEGR
jgi:CTP synthase (UTP-ammonia lyase)